jgi:hypothetical protein
MTFPALLQQVLGATAALSIAMDSSRLSEAQAHENVNTTTSAWDTAFSPEQAVGWFRSLLGPHTCIVLFLLSQLGQILAGFHQRYFDKLRNSLFMNAYFVDDDPIYGKCQSLSSSRNQ